MELIETAVGSLPECRTRASLATLADALLAVQPLMDFRYYDGRRGGYAVGPPGGPYEPVTLARREALRLALTRRGFVGARPGILMDAICVVAFGPDLLADRRPGIPGP